MKKISDRFRKSLRTIFRGIGVSVVSLIIQACYGPMPPRDHHTCIRGTVKTNETNKPIKEIKVSIEKIEDNDIFTDEDGGFILFVPPQEEYILKIEDIDGPLNGGSFKGITLTLNQAEADKPLLIGLDADI